MAEEVSSGCARPTGGPVGGTEPEESEPRQERKEKSKMLLIGRKAPDFTAPGYHQGKFVSLKLSEYLGQWVLLCFYPGDFTFV